MSDEATITATITIKVKPEAGIDVQQKEAEVKQNLVDQINANARIYDWGLQVDGTVESTLTDPVEVHDSKPDYEG